MHLIILHTLPSMESVSSESIRHTGMRVPYERQPERDPHMWLSVATLAHTARFRPAR